MFSDAQLDAAPWLAAAAMILSCAFVVASACRCWLQHGELHPGIGGAHEE